MQQHSKHTDFCIASTSEKLELLSAPGRCPRGKIHADGSRGLLYSRRNGSAGFHGSAYRRNCGGGGSQRDRRGNSADERRINSCGNALRTQDSRSERGLPDGGAYAIAALAYGTDTVRKVEKIVGPGNAYVAAAKKIVYGSVAIDMVAGPSEIMIVADSEANPAFIAADMLSQAEHGSGLEQAVLVTDCAEIIHQVKTELLKQAETLSRNATVERVLEHGVFFIEAADIDEALVIAGNYAPEHIELMFKGAEHRACDVKAAGAVFLGQWTPEPAGDFTAGPSHVLPTAGTAKFFHGLSANDFMRRSSTVQYTEDALMREVDYIEKFAEMEWLDAHGRSGSIRRKGSQK